MTDEVAKKIAEELQNTINKYMKNKAKKIKRIEKKLQFLEHQLWLIKASFASKNVVVDDNKIQELLKKYPEVNVRFVSTLNTDDRPIDGPEASFYNDTGAFKERASFYNKG